MVWATETDFPYSELVIRMVQENEWFSERLWKYSIIGEDALDILVDVATEEHNIAWS